MSPTRMLIKAAVDGLSASFDKIAVVPVEGGQIPPPQGSMMPPPPPGASPAMMDPSMGGGAPMDPMAGGAPPGMDPAAMGGMPPGMDPAAMGGMPPGMDPAAMGGMPPGMDPAATGGMPMDGMVPPPAPPAGDPSDPAVPLSAIAGFTTAIIEATKGKRTADPTTADPAAADPAAASGLPSAIASLGGAPSDAPAPLPGMPQTGGAPKAARALDDIIAGIKKSRGYSR